MSSGTIEPNLGPAYRFAGIVLLIEAVISVATMLMHPEVTQSTAVGVITEIGEHSTAARWVHGLMMVFVILNYFAISRYGTLLSHQGIDAGLGQAFYLFGAIAFLLGATVSGFMMTALAERYAEFPVSAQDSFLPVARAMAIANQSLAKSATFAYGITAVVWAIAVPKTQELRRVVGVIGGVVGTCLVLGILSGTRLDVFWMTIVTFLLAIWYVCIALDLIKTSQQMAEAS